MPAMMSVFGAAMYSYLTMVLLQRMFDNAIVGIIAFVIVAAGVIANVRITRWNFPPILAAWIIPLLIGLAIGYVNPVWHGISFVPPFIVSLGPVSVLFKVIPYFSSIVPMTIYQVFQDIAAVEGGVAAGDKYDARWVLLSDALGTVVSGLAGSVIAPIVYAVHPPYKAIGARVGYQVWTPIIFLLVVAGGLLLFVTELFPWPILAPMIAFIGIGVGQAIFNRVPEKYYSAVLLGLVIPAGAIVMSAVNSILSAFGLSAATPTVATILDTTIHWSSIQGLGNGFLLLVLVASALLTELIDRKFSKAALWCLLAALFSWIGLVSSPVFGWAAAPNYAAGWIVAAIVLFSARWWSGEKQEHA
jgi:AGZA family xanthine/uracil permease-like MFS transporter